MNFERECFIIERHYINGTCWWSQGEWTTNILRAVKFENFLDAKEFCLVLLSKFNVFVRVCYFTAGKEVNLDTGDVVS